MKPGIGWIKNISVWMLGMTVAFAGPGRAAVQRNNKPSPDSDKKQEKYSGACFSKDTLIDALKALNRNPQDVQVVSAMCYKMAAPQDEIEFQCPACGKKTAHSLSRGPGILVQQLEYIRRSLQQMPYKIRIDAAGLCSACGKDKPAVLVMHVGCFGCGKEFSWEVENQEDIDTLHWLYMVPPFQEIDGHYLGVWGAVKEEQSRIRQGAVYIRNHVFCPVCRSQIPLPE